ncbi:MAG: DUF5615 family PIN-like protein [Solirubrobacteraceae bacterium MAG38_C4-C5]|nr:DUF5615 family PIN-like protein [Candidatus Siliceabacter maunaloa]
MRLLLDEHYSPTLAQTLRDRGHDVVALGERADLSAASDHVLLEVAEREGRALVTNNVRHLVPLAAQRLGAGESHAGLVLTSDRTLPRSMGALGAFVSALDGLLAAYPADDALRDQTCWLAP